MAKKVKKHKGYIGRQGKPSSKKDVAEAARVAKLGPEAVFVASLERVQDCSDVMGKAGLVSTEKMYGFELDGMSSSVVRDDGDVRLYSKKNHHRWMALRADLVVQRWIKVFFDTFGPQIAPKTHTASPLKKQFDPIPDDLQGEHPTSSQLRGRPFSPLPAVVDADGRVENSESYVVAAMATLAARSASENERPVRGSAQGSKKNPRGDLLSSYRPTSSNARTLIMVPQNECIETFLKFAKAIFTPSDFEYKEVREIVETDFVKDVGISCGMSFEQFEKSIFELVDTWTDGISAVEYRLFLEKLFYRTTVSNVSKHRARYAKRLGVLERKKRNLKARKDIYLARIREIQEKFKAILHREYELKKAQDEAKKKQKRLKKHIAHIKHADNALRQLETVIAEGGSISDDQIAALERVIVEPEERTDHPHNDDDDFGDYAESPLPHRSRPTTAKERIDERRSTLRSRQEHFEGKSRDIVTTIEAIGLELGEAALAHGALSELRSDYVEKTKQISDVLRDAEGEEASLERDFASKKDLPGGRNFASFDDVVPLAATSESALLAEMDGDAAFREFRKDRGLGAAVDARKSQVGLQSDHAGDVLSGTISIVRDEEKISCNIDKRDSELNRLEAGDPLRLAITAEETTDSNPAIDSPRLQGSVDGDGELREGGESDAEVSSDNDTREGRVAASDAAPWTGSKHSAKWTSWRRSLSMCFPVSMPVSDSRLGETIVLVGA